MRKTLWRHGFVAACTLAFTWAASAQPAPDNPGLDNSDNDNTMAALRLMLARAQMVRTLAAEHLFFLESKQDQTDVHIMEDAAQVMAFSLICDDPALDAKTLNDIANDTTLKIALLLDASPVGPKITQQMQGQPDAGRILLAADVSATVLMFKIGRRRGLFDSLKTDFGQARFCAGLGPDTRTRYNGLVQGLKAGN